MHSPDAPHAVPKGTKRHLLRPCSITAEVDMHHGDAIDHGGCDGHDDEEDKGHKQEECADVVNKFSEPHLDSIRIYLFC